MNLLLHCCCGPCAVAVAEHFRSLGHQVTGWFFNPNIHPEQEHRRRRETFREAARALGLPFLEAQPDSGPLAFLLDLAHHAGVRCRGCYALRLRATAREAAARGFDAFSSTLLISPYQDLPAIAEVGRAIGDGFGVDFLHLDLREKYAESCRRAGQLGLYRQNYCGCLFSHLERSERRARRALARSERGAAVGRVSA